MTKAFVVGYPIKHSRSPLIHGHWLKRHGIEGAYERLEISPADFPEFLKSFRDQGYAGGNVTIPHKEAAFVGVDRRTARAERMKAVNTVWFEDGSLWGDNTDVVGFTAHLDQTLGTGWEKGVTSALVIGAGGAARAIVASLQDRNIALIRIANRTRSKTDDLIRDLQAPGSISLTATDWENLEAASGDADLIVNTTSLGMAGQPSLDLDLAKTAPDTIVADAVYVPLRTPLLAEAERRGLRIVDGLGMLLHQAVPGFARWFGVTPEVTSDLRAMIAADIENHR